MAIPNYTLYDNLSVCDVQAYEKDRGSLLLVITIHPLHLESSPSQLIQRNTRGRSEKPMDAQALCPRISTCSSPASL
jgi:hypothetical protein